MAAGDSARRQYERRLAAHKLRVRRTLPILLALLVVLVPACAILVERRLPGTGIWVGFIVGLGIIKQLWPNRTHVDAWAKGAAGEAKVARALAKLGSDFVLIHDRLIPGSRANIDHIVVGPTGIFVVETKNVAGKVTVSRGELRVRGRRRTDFAEEAWKEAVAVQTVAATLCADLVLDVRPLLCFTRAELPWGRTTAEGVPLLGPKGVVTTIRKGAGRLSHDQVAAFVEVLHARLRPA